MSIWLKNANIFTGNELMPSAEDLITAGERIVFVGSHKAAEAFVAENKLASLEEIDSRGAFVMSGFNDSHMHFLHYARAKKMSVNLSGASSVEDTVKRMKHALTHDFDPSLGLWLTGEGWNQDLFEGEKRFPTAKELDTISKDYPILILRSCFHIGVLNTKAMELMGIDCDLAAKMGACIETDELGMPNGILKEGVLDEVKSRMPLPNVAQLVKMMLECQEDLFKCGITSIQTDDFKYAPEGEAYALMYALSDAAETGRLKLRLAEQALLPTAGDMDEFFDSGLCALNTRNTFKIGAVKLLSDGSLGARTAYMRSPYADDASTRGIAVYTQQELDALVLKAHRQGCNVLIHAIGDGAIEMCINAISAARRIEPAIHPRHGIVHCQITDRELLSRMAENDITAYIQPVFINYDMHIVFDRVGKELGSTSYAWNDMAKLKIHTPFGTDCPVEAFNPLYGIYCAVSGRDLSGVGPFLPSQLVSRTHALRCYTSEGAYCTYEEHEKGMLKAGMLADFIMLDTDLLNCEERDILNATVTRTYLGGECVYKA